MGTQDFIDLNASSENCEHSCHEVKENTLDDTENLGQGEIEIRNLEKQHAQGMSLERDLVENPPIFQGGVEVIESVTTDEMMTGTDSIESGLHYLKDCMDAKRELDSSCKIDGNPMSGVKRARMTYDDQQPLVHVIYKSLPRQSKKKLEELLHFWSEWHAQQCSASKDSNEVFESGEETYFPALRVGSEKPSTVSFRMDNQVRKKQGKEPVSLDGESIPLYDREYAFGLASNEGLTSLEGALETRGASRCFNCGSYNHSLKECPKPRDNAAVNNARKLHQSKRNGPRIPTRYYQNSPGGKYDGLKPGVLGAETRNLLGLGELDPPPWLNRMRELGYPPGYQDQEDEDQPSGITIYADDETEGDQDGINHKLDSPKQKKKMSVEFPGINAPVPENADHSRWAASQGPLSFHSSRNQSNYRSTTTCSSEDVALVRSHGQRWPRDYRDGGLPDYMSGGRYAHSYGGFDPNYRSEYFSPRSSEIPIASSPNFGSFLSDRGRSSPLVPEDSPNQ